MQWRKQIPALLAGTALLLCGALPASAAETAVSYEAVPQQEQVSTGDTVEISIRCTEAELDPSGVSLTLQVADGYAFSDAAAGGDIQGGEFSYSYRDGRLILLYLDNAGGDSPVTPGQELATVTLVAGQAGSGAPLNCLEVDSAAVDGSGRVVSQEGSLDVGSLTVSGQPVDLPSPTPGGEADGEEIRPTATPAPTAVPTSTAAPDATARPQATPQGTAAAPGGTGTAAPSASAAPGAATGGGGTQGGQSATAAPDTSTGTVQTQNAVPAGETPTPTPILTTAPNGEMVQIFPEEETVEPVDRTNEVLNAPMATTPQPTEAPAIGGTVQPEAAGPAVPVAVTVGILAVIGLSVVLWRRRH